MTKPKSISSHPPIELSKNSVIMFNTFGIQEQFIAERIENVDDDISQQLHEALSESGILPEESCAEDCFTYGYVCRVLEPGKNWNEGRLRFRIVAEFVPDSIEVMNEVVKPIEPSLDTFR
jgi:hypothetical protein